MATSVLPLDTIDTGKTNSIYARVNYFLILNKG